MRVEARKLLTDVLEPCTFRSEGPLTAWRTIGQTVSYAGPPNASSRSRVSRRRGLRRGRDLHGLRPGQGAPNFGHPHGQRVRFGHGRAQGRRHGRMLMVGSTARNTAVVDFLRRKVPEEAPYFEALGAAHAAFERGAALPEQGGNKKGANDVPLHHRSCPTATSCCTRALGAASLALLLRCQACWIVNVGFPCRSEELLKLFNGKHSVANEGSQGANRQLFMLRNGEIHSKAGFCHDKMASNLSNRLPPSPLKCLDCLFPRDIRQAAHTGDQLLHGDHNL